MIDEIRYLNDDSIHSRKFFMDAIPMVGTSASVVMLTKMINDNEVTGMEADMWMTTLAFIQSPSKDMIREVLVSFIPVKICYFYFYKNGIV